MIRIASIVAEVSNHNTKYILTEMPLKLVYSFEHVYFLKKGYKCKLIHHEESLEQLMNSV